MEIPRSLLDELTDAVNALSGAAQQQAESALSTLIAEWDGVDVAALREATIATLEAIEGEYADLAAGAAATYYDDVRAAQSASGKYSAIADSRRSTEALAGAVRAIADYAVNGDVQGYKRECISRIDGDIRRSANSCVAYNASKDPAKPYYARVPSGGETCGFCLMLASFGFHYTTEEAASHAHANCDCRIVPEFGKVSIAGYDPNGMYSRYNKCLDALGGRDGVRADWDAMPKAERDAYIASHGNSSSKAFEKYYQKRVTREIETRDAGWFQHKTTPKCSYQSARALGELKAHEEATRDVLRANGFVQRFLERSNEHKVKTADVLLGSSGRRADFKSPMGSGFNCIDQAMRDAGKKADIAVIHLQEGRSQLTIEEAITYFKQYGKRRGITEALFIDYDNTIRRVKI